MQYSRGTAFYLLYEFGFLVEICWYLFTIKYSPQVQAVTYD